MDSFAAMLAINNLSYYIGGRPIYENASLHVKPKDKIGLIGLNGKGKSTSPKSFNPVRLGNCDRSIPSHTIRPTTAPDS